MVLDEKEPLLSNKSNISGRSNSFDYGDLKKGYKSNEKKKEHVAYLFKYIILAQIAVYLEAGAIPCLLDRLSIAANMNEQEQGALGGVVYLALSAASPLCGYLFKHYHVKLVLGASLIANNLAIVGFALVPMGHPDSSTLLIFARACIGFTQSFICVYSPLWVDEYAPTHKVAGWMSYLQGSVPLGVMLGYLIGAVSNWMSPEGCFIFMCWRWPFLFQFLVVLPLMFGIFCIPSEHISIHQLQDQNYKEDSYFKRSISMVEHHPHVVLEEETHAMTLSENAVQRAQEWTLPQRSGVRASYIIPRARLDSYDVENIEPEDTCALIDEEQSYGSIHRIVEERTSQVSHSIEEIHEDHTFWQSLIVLLNTPVFLLIVFGLTAVYFVVTGVQYWGTIFMIKSLHGSRYLVNVLFVVIAGTGPITGVFFGGWIIDKMGGYRDVYNRAIALRTCVMLGFVAAAIALLTTFIYDLYLTALLLWMLLFFGGSILPACTGIFISVIPKSHRPFASSFSVMVFNLLGYSLSPYFTGVVMNYIRNQQTHPNSWFGDCTSEECIYRLGFRFCMAWSLWSFLCITMAWFFASKDARKWSHSNNQS